MRYSVSVVAALINSMSPLPTVTLKRYGAGIFVIDYNQSIALFKFNKSEPVTADVHVVHATNVTPNC
jgi:hypothetical protein